MQSTYLAYNDFLYLDSPPYGHNGNQSLHLTTKERGSTQQTVPQNCLTVMSDGRLKIATCNDSNSQKFNYVLNNNKTWFTTPDNKCLNVNDVNYVSTDSCDNKINWQLLKSGAVKDTINDRCWTTDPNQYIIVGKCTNNPKFDINFTSVGEQFCKQNTSFEGCSKYNLDTTEYDSQIYGNPSKYPFIINCKNGISEMKLNNYDGRVDIKCADDTPSKQYTNSINTMIDLDRLKHVLDHMPEPKNDFQQIIKKSNDPNRSEAYYVPDFRHYKTKNGFTGMIVNSTTDSYNSMLPFGSDAPFTLNGRNDTSDVFECPQGTIVTQVAGTHDTNQIKSVKIHCDNIGMTKRETQDIVYSTLSKILQTKLDIDYSKDLYYKEITELVELKNINQYISHSKCGTDDVVLIKLSLSRIRLRDLDNLFVDTSPCSDSTLDFDKKTPNYELVMDSIHELLSIFDKQMVYTNVSDVKDFISSPKLFPLNQTIPNMVGMFLTFTNCSNLTVFCDQLFRDAVTFNKPAYIIVSNSNICFRNEPTKPQPYHTFNGVLGLDASDGPLNHYTIQPRNLFTTTIEAFSQNKKCGNGLLFITIIALLICIYINKFSAK